jgi:hypothetical protein
MKPLNSRAVSESLESYAGDLYAESTFFSALEFFSLLGEEEARYSRAMWRAIIRGRRRADAERLVEAARLEIWEHITFWDDVYYAILGMETELAS